MVPRNSLTILLCYSYTPQREKIEYKGRYASLLFVGLGDRREDMHTDRINASRAHEQKRMTMAQSRHQSHDAVRPAGPGGY